MFLFLLCFILLLRGPDFLTLVNPDYYHEFIIFSFSSQDTINLVLLQNIVNYNEKSISFMSNSLTDSQFNYSIIEKQAYSLFKSLKNFISYVSYNNIKDYVHYPMVKDVLSQQYCLGNRGKWVSKIHEYDQEIKPTKIIKGQGLAQMLIESNEEPIQLEITRK
jgi:hypothetical protein